MKNMMGWIISAKSSNSSFLLYRGDSGSIAYYRRDLHIFSSKEEAQWLVGSFHAMLREKFPEENFFVNVSYENVHDAFTKKSNIINNRAQLQMSALQRMLSK